MAWDVGSTDGGEASREPTALRLRAGDPPAEVLDRRRAAKAILATGLALSTALIVDAIVSWQAGGSGGGIPPVPALTVAKVVDAAVALLIAGVLVRRLPTPRETFGLRRLPLGQLLAWGCLGLAGLYAVLVASAFALMLVQLGVDTEWISEDARQRVDLLSSLVGGPGWQATVLLVAVAVHEELLFRGLMMPALRGWVGWLGALVVSSVVFGALHGEQGVIGVLQASGLGLALGGLYLVSGSIWPAVLAHFAFDRIQFALVNLLLPFLDQMASPPAP